MDADPFAVTIEALRARRGVKWAYYDPDVINAWVADMDFPPAPCVRDALVAAIDRGDLLYYGIRIGEVVLAWRSWQERHHGWRPEPERVMVFDDVIGTMRGALLTWCRDGRDGAVVQTPVYPPFLFAVADTPARLVENPLVDHGGGRWAPDIDDLRSVVDDSTRILLLCNPQNPTGRVFTRAELGDIAALAVERDLLVVVDEIWADLVYPPAEHVPFATLGDDVAERTITLSSSSKAFNLGGMRCAVAHFGSAELQREFTTTARPYLGESNALAIEATLAAWKHGESWLDELRPRLLTNRDHVVEVLARELPDAVTTRPEATYLSWIDFSSYGLASAADHLLAHGRVALSAGSDFAARCGAFARLNFATTPEILDEVLERVVSGARTGS